MLPFCSYSGWTDFHLAFYTASSAISGTGMELVPTSEHWTFFGQFTLMLIIQIGGLGVMTMASLVGSLFSKRMGLTEKILAASDIKSSKYGELGSLLRVVLISMAVIEAVLVAVTFPRFLYMHEDFLHALWHSVFFAVSAFNNAGFDISADGVASWGFNIWIIVPTLFAIFMGSIGFPVILNIFRAIKKRSWHTVSLHTKIVLVAFVVLDLIIVLWFFVVEWGNTHLFTPEINDDPLLHSQALLFTALNTRTEGFEIIDQSALSGATRLLEQIWIFIGGAPASTCSGIKVTTIAVLVLALMSEFRGVSDISIFAKRLSFSSLKVAVTIFFTGIAIVILFIFIILLQTNAPLDIVQFDTISAFANNGLSLGLDQFLTPFTSVLVAILMILGRIGTMTIVASMIRQDFSKFVRYPEENVILG
jgi:Trk-type K+ transport system membrane component